MRGLVIGLAVAATTAATGVGGSLFAVPLLVLGCEVPPLRAVGTAAVFSTLVRAAIVANHAQRAEVDWRVAVRMLAGSIPAMLGASWILLRLPLPDLRGFVLVCSGVAVLNGALCHLAVRKAPGGPPGGERRHLLYCLSVPIGVQMGFTATGAGALGTLVLMSFTRLNAQVVLGTAVAFGLGLSSLASVFHLIAGNCEFGLLAQLCLGGLAGLFFGTWAASRVRPERLRLAMLLLLTLVGAKLCCEGVRSVW